MPLPTLPVVAATCILLLTAVAATTAPATTTVTIPNLGTVKGFAYSTHRVFYDIPYGQDTSGDNRWRAPLPYPSWGNTTILDATASRDGCFGANSGSDPTGTDAQSYSENCLNLRVWTPPVSAATTTTTTTTTTTNATGLLPVAVWLHGGGFMYGTTGDPIYDGREYAVQHNTVLVTLNYRLGALGFLATPNSGGKSSHDLTGNYGLLDQQLALRWVQDHIASFGGDPTRVLIFGQSAGAMSIVCHLASPLSKGLFAAAEIRSPVGLHYRTKSESKKHAATLATSLGCLPLGKGIVPCLRKKSAADIVKKQLIPEYIRHLTDPGHGINFLQWIPTIDGIVLLNEPHDVIVQNQSWNRVPLIIGSMRNETNAWVPTNLTETEYEALFKVAMSLQWGKTSPLKIAALYNSTTIAPTWFEKVSLASTDWLMTCYVRRIARAASLQGVPTFLYHFLHYNSKYSDPTNAKQPNPAHPACVDGRAACHAGDNIYTMGSIALLPGSNLTNFEDNISNGIMTTTARLAQTSKMSSAAIAQAVLPLVPYDSVHQKSLAWGGFFEKKSVGGDGVNGERNGESGEGEIVASVVEKFRSEMCDFWDSMVPME